MDGDVQANPTRRGNGRRGGRVHHPRINDAKTHYHDRKDEAYYVFDGVGQKPARHA